MKQFFKMFFASLLSLFVGSGCLAFFFFISLIGAVAGMATWSLNNSQTPTELLPGTVLKLDLGELSEISNEDSFLNTLMGESSSSPLALQDIIESIRQAKTDERIVALYINSEKLSGGLASIDAVRDALKDFKTSGKPIIAYADDYSQKNYYLSSIADRVLINPLGGLGLIGISTSHVMLKDALDKFGIKMEIFRVGTFKSAVEPYMQNTISEANRKQTQEYLDGMWASIVSGIAEARNVSEERIRSFANQAEGMMPAETFVQAGLVDSLVYRTEVAHLFAEQLGLPEDDLRMISLPDFWSTVTPPQSSSEREIQVLFAEGEIVDSEQDLYSNPISTIGSDLIDKLEKIRKSKDTKALVLRINSPGGSAFLSEQIHHALSELAKEKPVVVSMGDVAASGGYYIAAGANSIVAQPTTITGSIGIFGAFPNASQLVKNYGINVDIVKTSDMADLSSISLISPPLREEQRQLIQKTVERGYDLFLKRVAEGRGRTRDWADSVGQGRVWIGTKAHEIGLVDKLGGLDIAIQEAASLANLQEGDYVVRYGKRSISVLEELLGKLEVDNSFVARFLAPRLTREEVQILNSLRSATKYTGIQTRLIDEYPRF